MNLKMARLILMATGAMATTSAASSWTAAAESGILPFQMTLRKSDGSPVPYTATAVLIQAPVTKTVTHDLSQQQRTLAVISAHMFQGDHWSIEGQTLPAEGIKGSVTNALCDLAVFEVDSKHVPTWSEQSPLATVRPDPMGIPALYANPIRLSAWLRSAKEKERYLVAESPREDAAFALMPDWSRQDEAESARFAGGGNRAWLASRSERSEDLGTLLLGKKATAAIFGETSERGLMYQPFGDRISAPVRLAPGMSGSPLIKPVLTGPDEDELDEASLGSLGKPTPGASRRWRYQIVGFGAEFIQDLNGSTFCSTAALMDMLSMYEPGKKKQVGPAAWKASAAGTPYLEYGPGRAERFSPRTVSGNGNHVSPGNSAQNLSEGADYWERQGTIPAIEWEGSPTIGFAVEDRNGASVAYLSPSHASVDLALLKQKGLRIRPISFASDLQGQLALRNQTGSPYFKAYAEAYPENREKRQPQFLSLPDGTIHVELYSDLPEGEPIRFTLNRNGSLAGSGKDYFIPVIRVKGDRGGEYVIDLQEFFFVDAARLNAPIGDSSGIAELRRRVKNMSDDSRTDALNKIFRIENDKGPQITFRKAGAQKWFTLRFNQVDWSSRGNGGTCGQVSPGVNTPAGLGNLRQIRVACERMPE